MIVIKENKADENLIYVTFTSFMDKHRRRGWIHERTHYGVLYRVVDDITGIKSYVKYDYDIMPNPGSLMLKHYMGIDVSVLSASTSEAYPRRELDDITFDVVRNVYRKDFVKGHLLSSGVIVRVERHTDNYENAVKEFLSSSLKNYRKFKDMAETGLNSKGIVRIGRIGKKPKPGFMGV